MNRTDVGPHALRTARLFLALIGVACATACGLRDTHPSVSSGRILHGRVEDLQTHAPVANARVTLFSSLNGARTTRRASPDGTFSIGIRQEGLHLEIAAEGYITDSVRVPDDDRVLVITLRDVRNPGLAAPPIPERWVEATSPHFRIISDGQDQEVREAARAFERFRSLIRWSLGDGADVAEPTVPLTIYALRSENALKSWLPDAFKERTAPLEGLFYPSYFGVDIFVVLGPVDAGGSSDDPILKCRHELHHVYFERTMPLAPPWLREGLAELWAESTVDGTDLALGRITQAEVEYLRNRTPLPIADLINVTQSSPDYRLRDKAGRFYDESMIFTAFLLYTEPDGERKFQAFRDLLQQGTPQEQALTRAWGPLVGLQRRFHEYGRRDQFYPHYDTLPENLFVAPQIAIRELPEHRVKALQGYLLASSDHFDSAAPLVEQALGEDASDSVALEARGLLERASGHPQAAAASFQSAAAQPDARFSATFRAATAPAAGNERGADARAAAEALIARTIERAPRFAPALAAAAVLRLGRDPDGAMKLAREAAELEPGAPSFEARAARIFHAAGHADEATSFAQHATEKAVALHDASESADVCTEGALAGFASIVAPACEDALALAPGEPKARGAHAIAKALAGDHAAAAVDVRFLLSTIPTMPSATRAALTSWIGQDDAAAPPRELLEMFDDPFW